MTTSGTVSRSIATSVELDTDGEGTRIIYWHRELPPFDAEAMGEHVVEAASGRVPGTLAYRDQLWSHCYQDLMAQVRLRLEQEIARLGGSYAHVLNESVDSKHDDISGETWLHGRFTYMLPPGFDLMRCRFLRPPPCCRPRLLYDSFCCRDAR